MSRVVYVPTSCGVQTMEILSETAKTYTTNLRHGVGAPPRPYRQLKVRAPAYYPTWAEAHEVCVKRAMSAIAHHEAALLKAREWYAKELAKKDPTQ